MKLTMEQAERILTLSNVREREASSALVEDANSNIQALARLDWEGSGAENAAQVLMMKSIVDMDPMGSFLTMFRIGVVLGLHFAEQELLEKMAKE